MRWFRPAAFAAAASVLALSVSACSGTTQAKELDCGVATAASQEASSALADKKAELEKKAKGQGPEAARAKATIAKAKTAAFAAEERKDVACKPTTSGVTSEAAASSTVTINVAPEFSVQLLSAAAKQQIATHLSQATSTNPGGFTFDLNNPKDTDDVWFNRVDWALNKEERGEAAFSKSTLKTPQEVVNFLQSNDPRAVVAYQQRVKPALDAAGKKLSDCTFVPVQFRKEVDYTGLMYLLGDSAVEETGLRHAGKGDVIHLCMVKTGSTDSSGKSVYDIIWGATVRADCGNPFGETFVVLPPGKPTTPVENPPTTTPTTRGPPVITTTTRVTTTVPPTTAPPTTSTTTCPPERQSPLGCTVPKVAGDDHLQHPGVSDNTSPGASTRSEPASPTSTPGKEPAVPVITTVTTVRPATGTTSPSPVTTKPTATTVKAPTTTVRATTTTAPAGDTPTHVTVGTGPVCNPNDPGQYMC